MDHDPTIPEREQAWKRAIETFGTAYIFQKRVDVPRRRLQWITWLGLAVPLTVGGLATTFGVNRRLLGPAIIIAGILATAQALLSLMALTSRWEDELSYGLESARANQRLSAQFERLASQGPADIDSKLDVLEAANQARVELDTARGLTDAELRMGMRAALRQFRRKCVECGEIPPSMAPSKCNTCGNF